MIIDLIAVAFIAVSIVLYSVVKKKQVITTWHRDNSKSLDYRHLSTCCDAELKQRHYINDKLLTIEEALKAIEYNKTAKPEKQKYIQYIYHCTDCGNKNSGKWEFKHWFRSPEE